MGFRRQKEMGSSWWVIVSGDVSQHARERREGGVGGAVRDIEPAAVPDKSYPDQKVDHLDGVVQRG